MALIALLGKRGEGKFALVDDNDFEYLSQFKWFVNNYGYAVSYTKMVKGNQRHVQMHRLIMNTPERMDTDHINMNTLDNRRANLRIVTRSQNLMNKPVRRDSKTGLKGVQFHTPTGRWLARIGMNGKSIYLGLFGTPKEAADAYDSAATRYFGEFSRLNKGGYQNGS